MRVQVQYIVEVNRIRRGWYPINLLGNAFGRSDPKGSVLITRCCVCSFWAFPGGGILLDLLALPQI
jgi:hypothetical protein